MEPEKPVVWMGSSRKDLLGMPGEIVRSMGFTLGKIQNGEDDEHGEDDEAVAFIKFLRGRKEFSGGKVTEIVDNDEAGTCRAVFTIAYEEAVFVLHCFQKKSKSGIATPDEDIAIVVKRLKDIPRLRESDEGRKRIAIWKAQKAQMERKR